MNPFDGQVWGPSFVPAPLTYPTTKTLSLKEIYNQLLARKIEIQQELQKQASLVQELDDVEHALSVLEHRVEK